MTPFSIAFNQALAAAGLPQHGNPIVDDKIHRFAAPPDKEANSWYVLHLAGDVVVGAYGCWRRDFWKPFCSKDRASMTPDERRLADQSIRDCRAALAAEEKANQEKARVRCGQWFSKFARAPDDHPYLKTKGVPVLGDLRIFQGELYDGWLALPLADTTGTIHSAQFISPGGQKHYCYQGRKKGCFFTVSSVPGGPILICEGYATGASLALATGWTVIAAMDCGNLLPVSQDIRNKYPNRTIILASDNDQFTEDNRGLSHARIAAKAIHAIVAFPEFGDESLADKPTDFNDLHRIQGIADVRRQIFDSLPVVARPIGDFKCPEKDDPTELLKYRYLCEHGSLLFNGPAGMGKSSALVQAAALWSNCLDFFGIIPSKPLKTVIIQAENDDGDIAQMRDGICTGLEFTQAQRQCFFQNVLIYSSWGLTGRAFCQEVVRPILDLHDPNLVAIDPALSFVGGDVKEQKVVGQFLREYLNPVIFEHTCACVMMHHTNKPLTGKEKSSWRNGEMAYTGSGSAEWANWPRAVIALQSTGTPGFYNLHASKRGARLAWTNDHDELIYQKLIAWSRDKSIIHWRLPDPDEIPEQTPKPKTVFGGRPNSVTKIATMNLHEFLASCLPDGESQRAISRRLESWLASQHIPASRNTCHRAIDSMIQNQKLSKHPSSLLYIIGPNA